VHSELQEGQPQPDPQQAVNQRFAHPRDVGPHKHHEEREGRGCVVALTARVSDEADREAIEHLVDTFEGVDCGRITSGPLATASASATSSASASGSASASSSCPNWPKRRMGCSAAIYPTSSKEHRNPIPTPTHRAERPRGQRVRGGAHKADIGSVSTVRATATDARASSSVAISRRHESRQVANQDLQCWSDKDF
jgi:hypothetical protein